MLRVGRRAASCAQLRTGTASGLRRTASGRDQIRSCRRPAMSGADQEEAPVSKPIEPEHVLLEFYTVCSFHPDDEPATQPIPLFVLGFREGSEPVFVWLVDKDRYDGSRLTKDAYWQHALSDLGGYF